ncbi:helix-turn-helix domain-containing protein [Kordia sp. YSTF-M3]|uniref:Helix-turn-helix domain-containing protein n=1 Tax=Kordia aestuariivivens TaxID=2759037 RepID=A0ABR7QGJ0_9FLAO|nr:helix-turn-helix transcriptional regulator [Kordia aestuariivivens]MBC8757694.1 helix-turn-helix domain-containing protein [Kordia aestuariivivens]
MALPDENDKSLGAALKRRRLVLEWTQQETANYFSKRKDSYQLWEWNRYLPHIRNRKKVVEFLGYNYWGDGTDSLANRCLLYRIKHGLTMSELASRINVNTRTIERIENMEKNVSSEMKNVINEYLTN